jgi:hypothetical protein
MKSIFISLLLFISSYASASTKAQFMGFQGMIQIFTADEAGGTAPDAMDLFNAMNVSTQGSVMGKGKTIQTPDKMMTFICAQGPKGPQCTILLRASAAVKMDPTAQTIEYQATGGLAEQLRSQFFLNENGEFRLTTTDGFFRVDVRAQRFSLFYDGKGLTNSAALQN